MLRAGQLRWLWRSVLVGMLAAGLAAGLAAAIFFIWWHQKNRLAEPHEYQQRGMFGPVQSWPIIPIHGMLLPDGRLMSFGTDDKGKQGAQLHYDVWDPKKGFGADSHLLLPNATATDIFCAGQIIVPSNDQVLIAGGDAIKNGERNFSIDKINWFDPVNNKIYESPRKLNQLRWYASMLTMPNGDILIGGGRTSPTTYTDVPELYSAKTGTLTPLDGAKNGSAFGEPNWTYPLMWVAPNGRAFVISTTGDTFFVDAAGAGHIEKTSLVLPWSDFYLPAVMYRPGKIMVLRKRGKVSLIELNDKVPTARATAGFGFGRVDGSLTVMADGKVLLNGGSFYHKQDVLPHFGAEIWDPDTEKWSPAASGVQMRLYHSISLLLPDATVLVAGGGAGGDISPQENLNAEVYYPPYLFDKDGSGKQVAIRPVIEQAPAVVSWGEAFSVNVTAASGVQKVAFIKMGSVTHTANFEQRYMELPFKAEGAGGHLALTAPAKAEVATPGYYMLFVLDARGVPSVAKIIKLI